MFLEFCTVDTNKCVAAAGISNCSRRNNQFFMKWCDDDTGKTKNLRLVGAPNNRQNSGNIIEHLSAY